MKVIAGGYVHYGQYVYRLNGRTVFRRPFLQGIKSAMEEAWFSSVELFVPECIKTHFKVA